MATNSLNLTELDFNNIKSNLKKYLQQQSVLKDYNYEGSALSTLLDILAYNTQYNAYYLNMVANEMFLDTALQRNSVISQAKLLNYTPKSAIAPTATITLTINNVTDSSLTLPKFTRFLSEKINGVSYTFVTTDSTTVNVVNGIATFSNISIKQGIPTSFSYVVDSIQNPKYLFRLPSKKIDTTTLSVSVVVSSYDSSYQIFKNSTDYLNLDSNSTVYFLQEGLDDYYEIYFGDGILGQQLTDGNIVNVSYLTTEGTTATGASSFTLMDPVSGYSNAFVTLNYVASNASDKETIDSIKFQAPKSYAAQNRAVTKNDYITAIQQNKLGFAFDSVSVWGGQENNPPVYGQIFVSLKPAGSYVLTATQKQRILKEVIRPISIMTVEPSIVDPDYTYIQLTVNVYYDPNKTSLTSSQLSQQIKINLSNYAVQALNTFNSTFSITDFTNIVTSTNKSILTNEIDLTLQKKFFPFLTSSSTYNLNFGAVLEKSSFLSGVSSYPKFTVRDIVNPDLLVSGVYIEEVASETNYVESISILNHGYGYQYVPTVTIVGDGSGATAYAILNSDNSIKNIIVNSPGSGYSTAVAKITNAPEDKTGNLGSAIVNLSGRYGTLRSYYYDNKNGKKILNSNVGTIDYQNGIVSLTNFSPTSVDNDLGQLTITCKPTSTIISSSYNRIISIDPYDPSSIVVNMIAKTT
jgi:hypothetical protein